jgi:HEPN domain-containing protein
MKREAEDRLADADFLSQSICRRSDANYLLQLLAFEILLKAVLRITSVNAKRGHSYRDLFEALPAETQASVRRRAIERMGNGADYSGLPKLLETFGRNFIALRYPYERYEGLSDEAYAAMGEAWVRRGAPLGSATFVYHSEELYGLNFALLAELDAWSGAQASAS